MIAITRISSSLVRVNVGTHEHYAVRVDALEGGHAWLWGRSARPVGYAIRQAIDAEFANGSAARASGQP